MVLDKDRQAAQYSGATLPADYGVPTYIDADHAIALNKVIVIDGGTVITGSFNFTKAAGERRAENVLVVEGYAGLAAA